MKVYEKEEDAAASLKNIYCLLNIINAKRCSVTHPVPLHPASSHSSCMVNEGFFILRHSLLLVRCSIFNLRYSLIVVR